MSKFKTVQIDMEEVNKKSKDFKEQLKKLIPDVFIDNTEFCKIGSILYSKINSKQQPLLFCFDKYQGKLFFVNMKTGYVFKNRVNHKDRAFDGISVSEMVELLKALPKLETWTILINNVENLKKEPYIRGK